MSLKALNRSKFARLYTFRHVGRENSSVPVLACNAIWREGDKKQESMELGQKKSF